MRYRRRSLPPAVSPRLLVVFREQPGVLLDRRFVGGGNLCATGGDRRLPEYLCIYPQQPLLAQDERPFSETTYREPTTGSRTRRAAWRTWRRLLEAALLARSGQSASIACSRQQVARRESEQFHQVSRFPHVPGILLDGPGPYRDTEATEQRYPQDLGFSDIGVYRLIVYPCLSSSTMLRHPHTYLDRSVIPPTCAAMLQ